QCLFVGKNEGKRGACGHGSGDGGRQWLSPHQLWAAYDRSAGRRIPGGVGAYCRPRPRCMIYLDYQATTPLAPEVAAVMRPWVEEKFANPHSPSKWGREAAAAIEVARGQVDRALGLPGG